MTSPDSPQIFVAVDGSPGSAAALQWAVRDAKARGGTVTAVMAWTYLDQRPREGAAAFDPHYDRDSADAALHEYVVGAVASEDAATVGRRVICDLPANAIINASHEADIVVVGSRGHGGFKRLMLGSVAHQVVTYSWCPVVVVPSTRPDAIAEE